MYLKTLVEQDVQNGGRLVAALSNRLHMLAAFWLNMEEANEWRLVIVSPVVAEGGARSAYRLVGQLLAETEVPIPLDNISILSPVDLRYKQVRLASQGVPSGVTVAKSFTGLGFAGDAYIYIMN